MTRRRSSAVDCAASIGWLLIDPGLFLYSSADSVCVSVVNRLVIVKDTQDLMRRSSESQIQIWNEKGTSHRGAVFLLRPVNAVKTLRHPHHCLIFQKALTAQQYKRSSPYCTPEPHYTATEGSLWISGVVANSKMRLTGQFHGDLDQWFPTFFSFIDRSWSQGCGSVQFWDSLIWKILVVKEFSFSKEKSKKLEKADCLSYSPGWEPVI